MPNDPRAVLALGALTAMVSDDHDGYLAVTDEFEGGTAEAFAAMTRVAQMLVKMLAETHGVSEAEMLTKVGLAMAAYDEGFDGDS